MNKSTKIWEWGLLPYGDTYIKLYVEERNRALNLCILTTILPVIPLKVDLSLNQLAKLTAGEAFKLYQKLICADTEKEQIKQERDFLWLTHNQQTAI